jgi:3-carboxy-cis,cis-muconate cycloisomerase
MLNQPTNLLDWMYQDKAAAGIFSLSATYQNWIAVEIALAQSQCKKGIISNHELQLIEQLGQAEMPDMASFHASALNVGYPIIALLAHLNSQLHPDARGVLHVGATTQDIMDTALALQVHQAGSLLLTHIDELGQALKSLVMQHTGTIMPGRTHAQHAVPTTFGLKCAIYLSEINRHRTRIRNTVSEASRISLYGAAGTSAAMGIHANEIRQDMAKRLGLNDEIVPWHVSRDRFLDVSNQCANLCVTLIRMAREIIDLSRNEIDEVYEPGGHHKGASSTMPQKRNPVMSEAIIGLGLQAIGHAQMMFRAGEVSHERAAGEWQLEWKALPEVFINSITAIGIAGKMLGGLGVNVDNMRENLKISNGLIMSEAYMIELSRSLGREKAHDVVHEASRISIAEKISLEDSLIRVLPEAKKIITIWPLLATDYLGNSNLICAQVIDQWNQN